MPTETQINRALSQKLLGRRNHEDPKRSELHAFILKNLERWEAPKSTKGWEHKAARLRSRLLDEVFLKGLPANVGSGKPNVVWGKTIQTGKGYKIRKVRYEGYPGMWIPALMYEPTRLKARVPVVLNPNGHHLGGKAMDYKQARCINLAKRGMIALNTEFVGMGELSMNRDHQRIAHLDLCGIAGVSVFYLAMKRGLEVLLSHPNADPDRVAMTGLSGGGWQTAVLSAIDERITTIVPVAGHSPVWQKVNCRADIGDLEQNPVDLCTVADYDLLTALFAPRSALLIYNLRDDCCFRSRRTYQSIYKPVKPLYTALGVEEQLAFYENSDPGTHNYEADSRQRLYRFLNEQFHLDTPEEELPFEDELLSERDLEVGLPDDNATFLSLAAESARKIKHPTQLTSKQIQSKRRELANTLKLRRSGKIRAERVRGNGWCKQSRLRLDGDWTVPVTEFSGKGRRTLVLADGGRRASAGRIGELDGSLVTADVYGTGESTFPAQWQMVLSATGERPLGILVGQILDVAKWASRSGTVRLDARGPVVSFACLCAAALEPKRFASLRLDGMFDSLKRLIDLPVAYNDYVQLFCFGLLKTVDVPVLIGMTEGLAIEWMNQGPVYSAKVS